MVLRSVAHLATFALVHWMLHGKPQAPTPTPKELARILAIAAALAMIPSFDPGLFSLAVPCALPAIWILFWLAQAFTSPTTLPASFWILAWGMSVAVPVSLFGQLELDALGGAQDPFWAVILQPVAFVFAASSLAVWFQATPEASFSPRTADGLLGGLLVSVTVVVFLGAWHVPGVSDDAITSALGSRLAVFVSFAVFVVKCIGVAFLLTRGRVARILSKPRWNASQLCALSAANLVLTWIVLAVRGAG